MKTGIPWSGGVNTISAVQNQLFLYTPLNGIKRSTDFGYTWIDVTTPSGGDITSFHDINGAIYAVNTGLYKSSDLGAPWILAFSEGGQTTFNITHIGSTVFASSKNGVYMSTNAGNNWIIKNNNLPTDFLSADITSINGNLYVCYRGLGVYKSSNSGDNWTLLNDNLSNTDAYCITANNDYVYTGTFVNLSSCHESGVFRISDLTAIRSFNNEIPKSYILFQNYPNPFNPTTKIKFEIPSNVKSETSNVKITIYDILGREVATLVNEDLKTGSYEVKWNASNFSSGIYNYKLVAGDFISVKKMVLIK
jgi:hypothetical protein